MKEIIEKLKKVGGESWGVCEIQSHEARIIADALEVATYPPIVRAVLAFIEECQINGDVVNVFEFCAIDQSGIFSFFENKPTHYMMEDFWSANGASCARKFYWPSSFSSSKMLFRRTANGWEWVGNPNKQNIEQHGK